MNLKRGVCIQALTKVKICLEETPKVPLQVIVYKSKIWWPSREAIDYFSLF